MLGPQDRERACRAAEIRATRREEGARGDLDNEDKRHALDAVKAFEAAYGAKFPKAVAKISDDVEQLLSFYDYPAQHWVH